jgi:hypothetical protein
VVGSFGKHGLEGSLCGGELATLESQNALANPGFDVRVCQLRRRHTGQYYACERDSECLAYDHELPRKDA